MYTSDKIVILDIDETLISTIRDNSIVTKELLDLAKDRLLELNIGGMKYYSITRNYLHEFLIFCFEYFTKVIIWSAGERYYVEQIVNKIFANLPPPDLVLTRDNCLDVGNGIYLKSLFLLERYPVIGKLNLAKVLLIDDNYINIRNNICNAIRIPSYRIKSYNDLLNDETTPALFRLRYWLEQPIVIEAEDIRLLDKSNIFTT